MGRRNVVLICHYLKGEGRTPMALSGTTGGGWRFEQTYPPLDVENLMMTGSDLAPTGSVVSGTVDAMDCV